MINSDGKEKLEEIFNSLLEILEEHQVSPEDGALLSANLLFSSLNFLNEEEAIELSESLDVLMNIISPSFSEGSIVPHSSFKPRNRPYSLIGLERTWGLDPSLLDEEN
tara:strand:+ start:812 stop:1135 length:324 start_codon:yes stop_codon:yes gene_type:complete